MTRSKETISYDLLRDIGKQKLKEPNSDFYMHDDISVVIKQHAGFLLEVAKHSKRLNACSVASMARETWQMSHYESHQFGLALNRAFSHCIIAGGKAKTGEKLIPELMQVYKASCAAAAPEPALPARPLKRELSRSASSPRTKILRSYGVKVELNTGAVETRSFIIYYLLFIIYYLLFIIYYL